MDLGRRRSLRLTWSGVMSPVAESHDDHSRPFLVRLVHTPLPDLLRLRVTGRYDTKGLLMQSGLPRALQDYALRTVLQTGLWRSERIVVARELADRMTKDLACGGPVDELVEQLESPKKAARRIRREKRRARPLAWRVAGRTVQIVQWSIAVLALAYVVYFARFLIGKPTITRNCLADLNAEAKAVPEAEAAWPIYRAALLRLKPIPEGLTVTESRGGTERTEPLDPYCFWQTNPGDKHWDTLLDYTAGIDEALDLIRQATERPRLAFYYNDPADQVVPPVYSASGSGDSLVPVVTDENPMVADLPSGHLHHLRTLAYLLRADSYRAARVGDGRSAVADVRAMIGLVRHCQDAGIFSHHVFMVAQLNLTSDTIGAILAENAHCLTDEDLTELSACLAKLDHPEDFQVRADWERAVIRDKIQRMYTDNGRGGGYLTREVSPQLICLCRPLSERPWERRIDSLPVVLLAPVLTVGRREMDRFCMRILDEAEAESRLPLWRQKDFVLDQRFCELSSLAVVRYAPAFLMMRWINQGDFLMGQFSRQRYDAVRVSIALERYRRRAGNWPQCLDQLTPDLLPALPPDRFDGGPIKYRLVERRPVLYSVGVDRVDDGGTPPDDEYACVDVWMPPSEAAERCTEACYRGDWILWPPKPR